MNNVLSFGHGNAKLSKGTAIFDLPAGWSCPFAKECFSKSNPLTGKIVDGKHCRFRCYAATNEARAINVRQKRWKNFNLLRNHQSVEKLAQLIQDSLPHNVDRVRIHSSGDFYSERYFLAWLNVALNNPMKTFYGYTKALPHIVKYRKYLPDNFRFTASKGGTHDHLIAKHHLKFAEVVFSLEEAEEKGLQIDHDDSLAFANRDSFALLLHATQPVGTPAAAAWAKLMRDGIGGYTNEKGLRKVQPNHSVKVHIDLRGSEIFLPRIGKGNYQFVPKTKGFRMALKEAI